MLQMNNTVSTVLSNEYQKYDILKKLYYYHAEVYSRTPFTQRVEIQALQHGKKILQNREEINAYIALYGAFHLEKLLCAFRDIDKSVLKSRNIKIYDWGCGQGIGSLSLINYLADNIKSFSLNSINLIEPSKVSIVIAEKYIRRALEIKKIDNVKINCYNKKVEDVSLSGKFNKDDGLIIHLFSNILDVIDDDIEIVNSQINNLLKSDNLFLCVGPDYSKSVLNIDRMFRSYQNHPCFENLSFRNETRYVNSFVLRENTFGIREFRNYQRIFAVRYN